MSTGLAVELRFSDFQGKRLPTYVVDGAPCWLATDVARALGYDRPDVISTNIRARWASDFIEGTDFVRATSDVLTGIRATYQRTAGTIPPQLARTSRALMLTESGVNLVCIRSRRPEGIALVGWLARDVLPSIRRTGAYSVETASPEAPAGTVMSRDEQIAIAREAMAFAGDDVDAATRARWAEGMMRLAGIDLSPPVPVANAPRRPALPSPAQPELGLGGSPSAPPVDRWCTAAEIGQYAGISTQAVGYLVTKLKIRAEHDKGLRLDVRLGPDAAKGLRYTGRAVEQIVAGARVWKAMRRTP